MVSIRNFALLGLVSPIVPFTASAASLPQHSGKIGGGDGPPGFIDSCESELLVRDGSGPMDLETRQPFRVRHRFEVATICAFMPLYLWGWYSTFSTCVDTKEKEPDKEKKMKKQAECAVGVVATLVSSAFAMYGVLRAVGFLSQQREDAVQLQPMPATNPKRALHTRDALLALSTGFGAEVRHLGHLNDTTDATGLRKRDQDGEPVPVVRPVFGLRLRGQDFHFTVAPTPDGENATTEGGGTLVRFGFGNGDVSDGSLGSNKKRFLEPWFSRGGIEFDITAPPLDGKVQDKNLGPDNFELWEAIFDQLKCQFHSTWDGDKPMHSSDMYFQIYDRNLRGTYLAGKLAPMGPEGQPSAISAMGKYKTGIAMDRHCTTTHMDMEAAPTWAHPKDEI